VLLVHRPRYDDWSLPKGKADHGEEDPATALREVAEETGLVCELGPELPTTAYVDNRGRPKVVRYWAMQPTGQAATFHPNDEVDELAWMPLDDAAGRLTYGRDLPVLDALRRVVDGLCDTGDR
jgi:8-oxo-dGTP diphosphatase